MSTKKMKLVKIDANYYKFIAYRIFRRVQRKQKCGRVSLQKKADSWCQSDFPPWQIRRAVELFNC